MECVSSVKFESKHGHQYCSYLQAPRGAKHLIAIMTPTCSYDVLLSHVCGRGSTFCVVQRMPNARSMCQVFRLPIGEAERLSFVRTPAGN